MAMRTREEWLDLLSQQEQQPEPDDTMAEAGRKILRAQLEVMLKNEADVAADEDIEAVHDMRVATRRMRSVFRLLGNQYKPRTVREFELFLKRLAAALGSVRDLDVLLEELRAYRETISEDAAQVEALNVLIERLEADRLVERFNLLKLIEKKSTARYLDTLGTFVTTVGEGVRVPSDEVTPVRLRHALPPLIYDHLATVRAYDDVLSEADDETLHALRIEFKRLRYTTTLFESVLGTQIRDFNKALAAFQDQLGRMQDIVTAEDRMGALMDDELDADQRTALAPYFIALETEHDTLRQGLGAMWEKFNSKSTMSKLSAAVAVL
jgi:CHAD domain-containing protein